MKAGKDPKALLDEIFRQANERKDYVIDTRELGFSLIGEENPVWALEIPGHEYLTVSENAHDQIARNVEIPVRYYERMRKEAPELLINNVKHWFEDQPKRRMVRALDGNARAFLSDRYRRIDNDQIVQAALPAIQSREDARIMSADVTPSNLYIKTIFTGLEAEIKPGDTIRAGFILTNSEVGRGSLQLKSFFYRDYCTNGCVFGAQDMFNFKRTHVGKQIEGIDYQVFSDETLAADDALLMNQLTDVVKAASDPVFFEKMVAKLRQTTETEQIRDPEAAVQLLAKEFDLRDTERKQALYNLIEDRDMTLFGAFNAVTKIANETESYDRASDLEEIGGKLIDLSMRDWHRIATAEKVAA